MKARKMDAANDTLYAIRWLYNAEVKHIRGHKGPEGAGAYYPVRKLYKRRITDKLIYTDGGTFKRYYDGKVSHDGFIHLERYRGRQSQGAIVATRTAAKMYKAYREYDDKRSEQARLNQSDDAMVDDVVHAGLNSKRAREIFRKFTKMDNPQPDEISTLLRLYDYIRESVPIHKYGDKAAVLADELITKDILRLAYGLANQYIILYQEQYMALAKLEYYVKHKGMEKRLPTRG